MKEDVINEAINQLLSAVNTKNRLRALNSETIYKVRKDVNHFLRERRERFMTFYDDKTMQLGFDVHVDRVAGTIHIDFDNREDVAWLILHTQVPFETIHLPDPYRGNLEIDL